MEIKSITQQAVSSVTDLIRIEYTVQLHGSGAAKSLNGNVTVDGETAGFCSANVGGASALTFLENSSLSDAQRLSVMSRFVEDTAQVFGSAEPDEAEEA